MGLGDWLWFAALLLGLVVTIVAPRVAWYVLVSQRQQARYRKQVRAAASRGLPPPEPPAPPNLWRVQYRFSLIGGALGLVGALIALVVFIVSTHR
jgi:hypothetical protein